MNLTPVGARGPMYRRWWFWVLVIILGLGALYLKSYFDWRGQYDLDHTDEYARGLAAQLFHYQSERLEKQYKNDTYGGDTPEETLRLFVEAIEKKDFELAAKYYVPEKQNEVSTALGSADDEALVEFTEAYKTGVSQTVKLGSSGVYEISILAKGETVPYYLRFQQNPFTKKWKILEP